MALGEFKHPELHGGEIFLTNANHEDYDEIIWKTKRAGKVAFSKSGQAIPKQFPVFVQRLELQVAGVRIKGRFNVSDP